MSTAAEQLEQHPHIEIIRRYYDACNSGAAAGVAACCTPDVVHYFLAPGMHPVRGNEALGRYWHEAVRLIAAEWRVEHAIACENEAVIEWSKQWTSRDNGERYIAQGAEWYAFRDGLISEIRAYYDLAWPTPRNEDTGLVDFPYAERGYTSSSVRGPGTKETRPMSRQSPRTETQPDSRAREISSCSTFRPRDLAPRSLQGKSSRSVTTKIKRRVSCT